jgi:hypothetical protein
MTASKCRKAINFKALARRVRGGDPVTVFHLQVDLGQVQQSRFVVHFEDIEGAVRRELVIV